jgi:hypothetical protein
VQATDPKAFEHFAKLLRHEAGATAVPQVASNARRRVAATERKRGVADRDGHAIDRDVDRREDDGDRPGDSIGNDWVGDNVRPGDAEP